MGNIWGGNNEEEKEEQDDEKLRRWRPALDQQQLGAYKRKKNQHKGNDSSDEGSAGGSDGGSVASSASKLESDSEHSSGEGDDKSDKSGGSEKKDGSSDDDDDSDEEEGEEHELVRKDIEKKKKKMLFRMNFDPLLSLHEPLEEDLEEPAKVFAGQKKKRRVLRAERAALDNAMTEYRKQAKQVAEWMLDTGSDDCQLHDVAQALGHDADELRYALTQCRRFTVSEDGIVERTLLQRILDVMETDMETLNEVVDKLMDVTSEQVKEAVAQSIGELRLKVAQEIDLIEHVDLEKEQRLALEQEREKRAEEKEESRRLKARRGRKAQQQEEEHEESSSSSSGDENNVNREAERKALAFRRVQVQRKIEDFLKAYTKGQNLTKISAKGVRYHRRVYIDTARRALVVQGASGPKFYPFASMKEVDIETRTSKEGRVETLVICAIAKRGRIVKELNLAFPDQAKANTFVNCITLFSMALRSKDS